MIGLDLNNVRDLRIKLEALTGLQVRYDDREVSIDMPHIKLQYEGMEWDTAKRAKFKFRATVYGSGTGEQFIANVATAECKFSKDLLTDPLTLQFSEKTMFITDLNNRIVIKDFKSNIDIIERDGKYIFAKPYQIEFLVNQS